MTEFENRIEHLENKIENKYESKRPCTGNGRIWTGLFIVIVGVAALMKSYFLDLPTWVFSWQMLLVVLGLFIGIRHNFRGGAWFILMLIGGIFLLDDFFPNLIESRFIWPVALITLGLFLMFKPRRRNWQWREHGLEADEPGALIHLDDSVASNEDMLDSTSIFGGVKKNILSKDFKGGDIVNIMGGSEINLSQADIKGRAILEVTQIFGGTKIIVPPHWDVKPEMAAIFGGIEDKRRIANTAIDHSKVLVLKGTSVFGGIEVKSF
jgi:predicted membrane protein